MKPFESTVKFREGGKEYDATVLAIKPAAGSGIQNTGVLIDLGFFKPVLAADGKTPLTVVGSSRQNELVQIRHDVPASQYELVEDWFFSLSDDELEALEDERERRIVEKRNAARAEQAAEADKQLLAGVTIKPSEQVMVRAAELWKHAIREAQQLDEHTDVNLPAYAGNEKSWEPWIEAAKKDMKQNAPATPSGEQSTTTILDKSGDGGDGGSGSGGTGSVQ